MNDMPTDIATNDQSWRTLVYGILMRPADTRIWLVPSADGWSLPHVEANEQIYSEDLGRVNDLMRETLRSKVSAYRYTYYATDEERHVVTAIYMLEPRPDWREPTDGRWADRAMLASATIIPAEHRAEINRWFDEAEKGTVPSERPPWSRPGWFDQTEAWISTQLAEHGYVSSAPIEHVRRWSLSCVLRAQTTTETIYFKAAAALPLFANEPVLLEQLSRWYPDTIPQPLSINAKQRWMLMQDWGPAIGWDGPVEQREPMYQTIAGLQIATAPHIDRLLEIGCVDRRLDTLEGCIDPLLADPCALALLDAAEQERLRALAPRLKAMCQELGHYNIPYTLVHGDFHAGNVAIRDGKVLVFDWTDASVAHPFFDLSSLFHAPDDIQTRLREHYFEAWTAFEPIERLREAWLLAAPLCALHHTISYQYIVVNLEPDSRAELASGLTFFGRKLLELMS